MDRLAPEDRTPADRTPADPTLVEQAGAQEGVVVADPREGHKRARLRSLSLRGLTAVGLIAGFVAMLGAPLAEAAGNTTEWPLALPVVIGAALLAAVAALAAYQASRSRSASRR